MRSAKVMIVEDESITAMAMGAMLKELGQVVCASVPSGEEALGLLDAAAPDLILMDIRLQGDLDGIETTRRIQARRAVPVAFMTAFSDADTLRQAEETRPLAFLRKPLEHRDLKNLLGALDASRADRPRP